MALHLVSQFNSIRRNADNRTADPAEREHRLDRYEERLAERERAVTQREKLLDQREHPPEASTPAVSLLRDHRPAGGVVTMTAEEIIRAGQVRRGEIEPAPAPKGLAGEILRAGQKRRGEIEDHKPRTEAEVVAAQIIEAGRRRRGEI